MAHLRFFSLTLSLSVLIITSLTGMKRKTSNDDTSLDAHQIETSQISKAYPELFMYIQQNTDNPLYIVKYLASNSYHSSIFERALMIQMCLETLELTIDQIIDNNGRTMLHYAAIRNFPEVIESLIVVTENNAHMFARMEDTLGWTASHHAAHWDNTHAAELLLSIICTVFKTGHTSSQIEKNAWCSADHKLWKIWENMSKENTTKQIGAPILDTPIHF